MFFMEIHNILIVLQVPLSLVGTQLSPIQHVFVHLDSLP